MRRTKEDPFFSIIIPTYNAMSEGKDLRRTVRSVADQTYGNWEIVVIDNFSSDTTRLIAREYPVKFFQVRGSIAAANNFALQKARGDYLLFLDSDQELTPNFLHECVELIRGSNVDCIGYRQLILDPDSNLSSGCNRMHNLERFFGAEPSDGIYCYSREIISGVEFPEELPVMEDYYFRQKILAKRPRVGYTKSIVMHHRSQSAKWIIARALRYGRVARKLKGEHKFAPITVVNYFPLTKRNVETRVPAEFVFLELVLFLPFILLKYAAFAFGYLLE